MDPGLLSLLPTGGVASVLVVIIVYLLRQNNSDRRQYRDDVAAIEQRAANRADAREQQYRADLAEVKDALEAAKEAQEAATAQVKVVLDELESERRQRFAAEDKAAQYRRERDNARAELEKGNRP